METMGVSSPIPSSIKIGMTIAMGVLDREAEGLVVTDSREADEESMTLKDGVLKSIRVNKHCALAFSGDAVAANKIAAHIYRDSFAKARIAQAIHDGSRSVLEIIDGEKLEVAQPPDEIERSLYGLFSLFRGWVSQGKTELPRVNVILVGRDSEFDRMWSWAWMYKLREDSWSGDPIETHCSVFGPGKPDGVCEKLKDPAIPLEERIHAVAEMYRAICPCGVNLDLKIRRASKGFILEPLAALSTNSSLAPDPSAWPFHAYETT